MLSGRAIPIPVATPGADEGRCDAGCFAIGEPSPSLALCAASAIRLHYRRLRRQSTERLKTVAGSNGEFELASIDI